MSDAERVVRSLMSALRHARRAIVNEANSGGKGTPDFAKIDRALKRGSKWLKADWE